ncbi:RING finger domain protein [Mycena chlorophos]|uniref:RING finger domain protein n=1 Tax=Mycena chlorophos TaxID=658473 RepID=A0A8H6RY98_MYCCL|nr:RING finger domain protein [Mycena chlorophos]
MSGRVSRSAAVPSTRTYVFQTDSQWQRSKSRSPSRLNTRADPFTLDSIAAPAPPLASIKRKRSLSGSISVDDVDRGQRLKTKPTLSQNRPTTAAGASSSSRPRKDKDSTLRPHVDATPAPQIQIQMRQQVDPALAVAEFERMRKELEMLKRAVHDNKKQYKKQNKTIEELRAQLAAEKLTREQQETTLATTSAKLSEKEKVVQSIEASLQCTICIEVLNKPHILVPCGHTFCRDCLRQWFSSPPANEYEDEDLLGPEYHLHREKKCPFCRARVVRRPMPVYIVKEVTSTLHPVPAGAVEELADANVWKGLFLEDYDSAEDDDEGSDADMVEFEYESDDGASEDYENEHELASIFGVPRFYESGSEDDDEVLMGEGASGDEDENNSQSEGSSSSEPEGEDEDDEGFSDAEDLVAAPILPAPVYDPVFWRVHHPDPVENLNYNMATDFAAWFNHNAAPRLAGAGARVQPANVQPRRGRR